MLKNALNTVLNSLVYPKNVPNRASLHFFIKTY